MKKKINMFIIYYWFILKIEKKENLNFIMYREKKYCEKEKRNKYRKITK